MLLHSGSLKSPAVQGGACALSCGRYLERNPVEAGLVALPWEYRWSSCRAYALGEPDPLLDEAPAYGELSPEPGRRRALWREFLLGEDPREGAVRRGDWAVGDDGFRRRAEQWRGRPGPRRRGRPPKAVPDHDQEQISPQGQESQGVM